ncbi:MAG: hypothetical protein OEY38_16035 [Gammaproteobacteria bacterium]|nr:hypothetical protein [Gammaproteobacteria bacterium]
MNNASKNLSVLVLMAIVIIVAGFINRPAKLLESEVAVAHTNAVQQNIVESINYDDNITLIHRNRLQGDRLQINQEQAISMKREIAPVNPPTLFIDGIEITHNYYQKQYNRVPGAATYHRNLVLYRQSGDRDSARNQFQELVSKSLNEHYGFLETFANDEASYKYLEDVITFLPDETEAINIYTNNSSAEGRNLEARNFLEELSVDSERSVPVLLALARVTSELESDQELSNRYLRDAIDKDPKSLKAVQMLAFKNQDNLPLTIELYESYLSRAEKELKQNPDEQLELRANLARAELAVYNNRLGNEDESRKYLKQLSQSNASAELYKEINFLLSSNLFDQAPVNDDGSIPFK